LGTSLGVRMADGRQEEHGHRNHMRAINTIYHCGGVREAVESGCLRSGILYECVKNNVPYVLAGSLRDDGPLPDTITDMNQAQDRSEEHTSELQSPYDLVCRLLLEKKKKKTQEIINSSIINCSEIDYHHRHTVSIASLLA